MVIFHGKLVGKYFPFPWIQWVFERVGWFSGRFPKIRPWPVHRFDGWALKSAVFTSMIEREPHFVTCGVWYDREELTQLTKGFSWSSLFSRCGLKCNELKIIKTPQKWMLRLHPTARPTNLYHSFELGASDRKLGPIGIPVSSSFGLFWDLRFSEFSSHRIHVWYTYLDLVDVYGKCR